MKHLLTLIYVLLLTSTALLAGEGHKPVYARMLQVQAQHTAFRTALFSPQTAKPGTEQLLQTPAFQLLQPNVPAWNALLQAQPEYLELSLPSPEGNGNWTLQLYRYQLLDTGFSMTTSNGQRYAPDFGLYYHGVLNNDPSSLAGISVFGTEIMGIISNARGNYDLGQMSDGSGNYVLYRSDNFSRQLPFDCGTADADVPAQAAAVATTCRNVRVYLECDYDLYTKRSSNISTVSTFVTGLFNQCAVLYTNESIAAQVSEVYVWTSTDPYIAQTTSSAVLSTFRTTRTTFNGNLAHLLSTRATNLGGIAYLDVLCSTTYAYAFSNIYNSYSTVPTYSWSTNVITHEMGHNLGSNHTQWCGWTGGALDNCYTTEGGCAAGPAPTNGGTIMSYCHITSYGVNLSNGFGTQPGNKIRLRFNAATCLSGANVAVSPATATVCSGGSVSLSASGGSTYTWTPTAGLSSGSAASISAAPTATTTYSVSSTVNGCQATANATVTVLPSLNYGTLASGNQTFSGSGNPNAIAFATAPSGGAGTFTYQWYSRAGIQTAPTGTATTNWTAISGATASSYDPPVQSASISYAVQVNPTGTPDCSGAYWASGVRQITVNAASAFSPGVLTTANQTFCSTGGNPAAITFSTAPSGASSYTYQWYYKNALATPSGSSTTGWTAISGATASSYDPPVLITVTRSYAVLVTPAGGTAQWASGARQITVLPAFNPGTVTLGDQSFCNSGNPSQITLSSNPVGSGAYNWRWYYTESSATACPTGSSTTGWLTNSTSANITGSTTTGAGITFDPISAGALNSGRTFAVFITPTANGSIPACGTAQWASNCRKTYVTSCAMPGLEGEAYQATLDPAYPNPAKSEVHFEYSIPQDWTQAHIEVYDLHGRCIDRLPVAPGAAQHMVWNVAQLAGGTYYYALSNGQQRLDMKKLVLLP